MHNVMHKVIAVAALVGASMLGTESQGAIITSADFSLGYGFNPLAEGGVRSWNGLENTAPYINVTTLGDFSLVPTMTGATYSGSGVAFQDRELTDGSSTAQSACTMSMALVGSWAGTKPVDAAADPNYRITINITAMSIYGFNNVGDSLAMILRETTTGHTQDYATFVPTWDTNAFMNAVNWDWCANK